MNKTIRGLLVAGACLSATVAVGTVAANARIAPPTIAPSPSPSASGSPSGSPSPSPSAPQTPGPKSWMHCPGDVPLTDGHLNQPTPAPRGAHDFRFDVTGTITPCAPVTQPAPGFGIAVYAPGRGYVADGGWAWFDQLDAAGGFRARVAIGDPGAEALCLVTGETVRVDCFALTWTADYTLVAGDRLSTGSPIVNLPVALPSGTNREPGCPTCIL